MFGELDMANSIRRLRENEETRRETFYDDTEDRLELEKYNHHMLNAELNSEDDVLDPVYEYDRVHDTNLLTMKTELMKALDGRKEKTLDIVVDIFNKVQDQNLSTDRVSDY